MSRSACIGCPVVRRRRLRDLCTIPGIDNLWRPVAQGRCRAAGAIFSGPQLAGCDREGTRPSAHQPTTWPSLVCLRCCRDATAVSPPSALSWLLGPFWETPFCLRRFSPHEDLGLLSGTGFRERERCDGTAGHFIGLPSPPALRRGLVRMTEQIFLSAVVARGPAGWVATAIIGADNEPSAGRVRHRPPSPLGWSNRKTPLSLFALANATLVAERDRMLRWRPLWRFACAEVVPLVQSACAISWPEKKKQGQRERERRGSLARTGHVETWVKDVSMLGAVGVRACSHSACHCA